MSSVEVRTKRAIEKELRCKDDQLAMSANLKDDLHADSLDMIELVMELEDEFSILIDDKDAAKMKTVGDVVKYIKSRVPAKVKSTRNKTKIGGYQTWQRVSSRS